MKKKTLLSVVSVVCMLTGVVSCGGEGATAPSGVSTTELSPVIIPDEPTIPTDNTVVTSPPPYYTGTSPGYTGTLPVADQIDQVSGFMYQINGDSVTVTGYRGSNVHAVIPDKIAGKTVTAIGYGAIFDSTGRVFGFASLSSITIPDSVTSIGRMAFYGNGLTSVTIPGSITSIGDGAFGECNNLTSIIIPNSVTKIGDWSFAGCGNLIDINIPDSVASIGRGAFSYCTSLPGLLGNPAPP